MTLTPRLSLVVTILALSAPAGSARAADALAGGKIVYNRDIRPILSDNCFHCHGNDKHKIKGKLLLNDRDAAIKKGAIVPGKPDESEAITRLFSKDAEDVMPPVESHKVLTDAQKALLKRWVAEGAEYQPHWAYIPPARPVEPAVSDAKWVRNPIDAFVLAELDARKLTPSAEADRRTLLRRLSLDLIGIPPTPAEVEAFVADKSADAYEKQVDRLLASPRFGERMAVPWLDAVRFADTVGFHGDQNQNVFPYRDYVINAFNSNKPFDKFTVEQLAGDLLPNPTQEQLIASGFNRLNMMTREGGAQAKEYIAKYQADRVRTVGLTWLGSTFGCAECHDHKFDPISAKDFYSLSAFFADVRQWGVYMDYTYTPNPDLKGWSNDHPFPPEIKVDNPYLAARKAKLEAQLADRVAAASAKAGADPKSAEAFNAWRAEVGQFLVRHADGWETLKPAGLPATPDGFVKVESIAKGKKAVTGDVAFAAPTTPWVASIRLDLGGDLLDAKAAPTQRQGIRLTAAVKPKDGAARKVAVYAADAAKKEPKYVSTEEQLGVVGGWKLPAADLKTRQSSVWLLDPPVKLAAGDTLVVTVGGDVPAPVRVSASPLASPDPLAVADAATRDALNAPTKVGDPASGKSAEARSREAYLLGTAWDAAAFESYKALRQEIAACRDGKAWMQVTVAQPPITTRVLPRGNWQDETGEVVPPNTPHFLPGFDPNPSRRLSRLDLANWIVSPQNPLTGRVIANRYWKMFFGTGLCASVEDLGLQGEWPSHPDLLDWLAVELRDPKAAPAPADAHEWDVKRFVRLLVTSNTYRQSSSLKPELRDVDPQNRLLSAQAPRRLEAEFVRDNALAAAGLLNTADIGGPSARPYQPEGYYAPIQFPDRKYNADPDDRQYRRGVYMHWQRTFLHPMLANFDAPSREDSICTRVVSNTPQQALTLLNDPEYVEASRVLAEKLIAAGGTDEQKLERAYVRAVARAPRDNERQSLLKFLAAQRQAYKAAPADAQKLLSVGNSPATGGDPAELAAWTNTCRVVLNLHEAITRY